MQDITTFNHNQSTNSFIYSQNKVDIVILDRCKKKTQVFNVTKPMSNNKESSDEENSYLNEETRFLSFIIFIAIKMLLLYQEFFNGFSRR